MRTDDVISSECALLKKEKKTNRRQELSRWYSIASRRDARREGGHSSARGALLTERYSAPHRSSHNLTFTSLLTITPQQAEDPRRSSTLAHFLCAIRITVLLACLIVEILTACAACMWVICASSTFLGVCPCLFSDSHHTCCILVLCPSGMLD
jgi:hypothetical protein